MNKPFFTEQLQARGISQREAGRRMGLASSQMVRLLDGKRKLQLSEAVELAQMLNLSLNEILLHAGVDMSSGPLAVPIIGILGGDGRIAEPPPDTRDVAVSPGGIVVQSVAVQARTAGSPLDWMDGWVFFCEVDQQPPEASHIGRFCLAQLSDGARVMGTIRRGYIKGTYSLGGPFQGASCAVEWVRPAVATRHP